MREKAQEPERSVLLGQLGEDRAPQPGGTGGRREGASAAWQPA